MLEHALEDCLTRMRLEGATPEECLALYPEFREELAPLLLAAADIRSLESLKPRREFRARARTRLLAHIRSNPHHQAPQFTWNTSPAFRYGASLALLFVVLASSGTALAQKSLPGDSLYGWKLASENIWYSLQSNPIEADLVLTTRRVSEIQAIQGKPNLEEIGVSAYSILLRQLALDLAEDPEKAASVGELLKKQKEQLTEIIEDSQGDLPAVDELFSIVSSHIPPDAGPPNGRGPGSDTQLPAAVPAASLVKKDKPDNGHKPDKGGKGKPENSPRNNQD
ncbi:MAG TPA: hypothetical protein VI703_01870 [Anaerolineales bacterium]|nr:hypothetical protein [Anaerolineales bacterium]